MTLKIGVATCQFPVSRDIRDNFDFVRSLMQEAKVRNADVAHFPEACLSGYVGNDLATNEHIDWDLLTTTIRKVMSLAASLELWVILGSAHRLTPPHKPHNSLYFISDRGQIVDRYDKRFLSGDPACTTGDLAHYSPGNHFSVIDVKGVRCGALICVDCRYPELYRGYKRLGVQLMFHSYNSAHVSQNKWMEIEADVGVENHPLNPATTLPGITQPAMMLAAAGSNHMWISCANSSANRACWPSFFVRPDGLITGRLGLNDAGAIISMVDTQARYYDSTASWRERAMNGILHSGELAIDARSDSRTTI
jgi:predicted amidohydrolase